MAIMGQLPSNVHPSLLILQGDEKLIKLVIKKSPELKIIHSIILHQSDYLLDKPCPKSGHLSGWIRNFIE